MNFPKPGKLDVPGKPDTPDKPEKMGFEGLAAAEQVKLGDCLWDIHAAGMKVLEFTSGRDFADYAESDLLQGVVTSMLAIIAARLDDVRTGFPDEFVKIDHANRLIAVGAPEHPFTAETVWRVVEELLPDAVTSTRTVLEDWHQA